MRRTYSTLISNHKGRTRLQQVIDWVGGPEFSGVLCFDECHKAKNFVPGKESQSTKVSPAQHTLFLVPLVCAMPASLSCLPPGGHSRAGDPAPPSQEPRGVLQVGINPDLAPITAIYKTIYHASCFIQELVATICRKLFI